MNKREEIGHRPVGYLSAGAAFLASFGFFLAAYPYHLIRREQLNLFVYDWDYIAGRFRGAGWLARLAGSFAEQFFCVRVLGPLIVSLLLVAIGAVTYRICRKCLGKRVSLAVAALIFLWSFLRECGSLYQTRYTIAVLGFLSLVLLALQFKKAFGKALAAALLLCAGAWALGSPCDRVYGKLWGVPRMSAERLIGLDAEVARENWDRVLKLSEKDLYMTESSVCYNLAQAMKGRLGNTLFEHSQADPYHFLLSVSGDYNIFANCLAGEQWYQLGDMTVAEQSAITALQASPEHTGARFIERLARVNIVTGQEAAAQKYLNLLRKTLFYRKWALSMLEGAPAAEDRAWIERARSNMAVSDFIYVPDVPRSILHGLLEANPDNTPAREYLLCYDLLRYDLEQFVEDYDLRRLDGHIYKEALVIWLGQDGFIPQHALDEYGLDDRLRQRMDSFSHYPQNYPDTYWYYYFKALNQ